jgi:hypothetical protein
MVKHLANNPFLVKCGLAFASGLSVVGHRVLELVDLRVFRRVIPRSERIIGMARIQCIT